jgi:hypothetical protein
MGARNQEGIGLSYWPFSRCSLATQFQTGFLESIPRPIAGRKFSALEMEAYGTGQTAVPYGLLYRTDCVARSCQLLCTGPASCQAELQLYVYGELQAGGTSM